MVWSGSPAEKRAYAQKKARERAAVHDRVPLRGFTLAPRRHRCDAPDIRTIVDSGTSIPGRQCTVCGRRWRYRLGLKGFLIVEVIPLTEKAPPPTVRSRPPIRVLVEPTGADWELPPEDLGGSQRCRWWERWRELRGRPQAA